LRLEKSHSHFAKGRQDYPHLRNRQSAGLHSRRLSSIFELDREYSVGGRFLAAAGGAHVNFGVKATRTLRRSLPGGQKELGGVLPGLSQGWLACPSARLRISPAPPSTPRLALFSRRLSATHRLRQWAPVRHLRPRR